MTTNVLDIVRATIATDSRWSVPLDFAVIYVDNTGFDKIEVANGHAFMFAGNGAIIQSWKDWIRVPTRYAPQVDGIALCVTRMADAVVTFEYGQDIVLENARFAGTGAYHAHLCWRANQCARQAVESAKAEDKLTGGQVKFIELRDGNNNLTNNGTIHTVVKDIVDRGWVMYNGKASIQLDEAIANDQRVADVVRKVASGAAVPSAPCDSMYNKWNDEDKARLKAALSQVFDREVL